MAEMAGMSGMPGMAGAEGLSGNLEELQLKLLSLLGNSAVVVAAAASGDESTVRDYLSKNPQEVRMQFSISKQDIYTQTKWCLE